MKKFIVSCLVVAVLLIPAVPGHAILSQSKTLASALACGKNATVYSSAMALEDLTGHVGIQLISTAGSITVTQQCSTDNTTWYDPTDAYSTALGQVIATQTVTTGIYIIPAPVFAPFIRYKIVEGNVAATAVTIKILYQTD